MDSVAEVGIANVSNFRLPDLQSQATRKSFMSELFSYENNDKPLETVTDLVVI